MLVPSNIISIKIQTKSASNTYFLRHAAKNASNTNEICYMRPPRGSQDVSRTAQDGFCFRFGRQLGAILGTFFRLGQLPGPQDASKKPSWKCLGAFWGRVGASWRPGANKSVSWSRLGLIFLHLGEVFCLIFG